MTQLMMGQTKDPIVYPLIQLYIVYWHSLFNGNCYLLKIAVFPQDHGIAIADHHYIHGHSALTILQHTMVFPQMFRVSLSFFEVRKNLSVTNLFNHRSMTMNNRLQLVLSSTDVSELTNIHSFTAYQYCIFVIWSENWCRYTLVYYTEESMYDQRRSLLGLRPRCQRGGAWVGDIKCASWTKTRR